jgi:hypothetical protein
MKKPVASMWRLAAALSLILVGLTAGTSYAITPPADGMIAAAVSDLDRYEAEASRLDPSRKANIRRLQQLLDLTEGRLEKSTNKAHPSWTEASKRLAELRGRLASLLAGTQPNTGAEGAEPAKPPAEQPPEAARRKEIAPAASDPTGRDITLPVIKVESPRNIAAGAAARISGYVGDDGSPPRLKANGRAVTLFRLRPGEATIARHTLAFRIDVPAQDEGEHRYVLEACDAAGNCVGEEVVVPIGVANRPSIAGRNYALIIGNNAYEHLPDLKTAVNDARAIADILARRYAFEADSVTLLENADRRAILEALEGLRPRLDVEDRLFLYYAGHGQIDEVTGEGFWQPVDAEPGKTFTWIANDDIRRQLKGLPAKHILVVADSCFSGSLTRSAPTRPNVPEDRFFSEIDSHWSRKVISSGGTEPVADSGSGGHSIFAHYFLKTLRENDAAYLTSFELYNRFVRAVTNNSDQKPQYGTIAKAGDEGFGDFTFILGDGG